MPPNKLTENRTGPLKRRTLDQLINLLNNLDKEQELRKSPSAFINELSNSETTEVIRKCFEELPNHHTLGVKGNEVLLNGKIVGIGKKYMMGLLNSKAPLSFKHFQILQKIFPELKDKILEKYKEKLEKKSQQSPE